MTPVLSAVDIHKSFTDPHPQKILNGVTLDLYPGESIAILGKSGSGKSSLLHILGTLDRPDSGKVLFPTFGQHNLEQIRRLRLGFVFQAFHLLEEYSLLENILMPARIAKQSYCEKKGQELLGLVGLQHKKHTKVSCLSGGEKQRAALARALCNDPDILLVDEPTGSLDAATAADIAQLLFSLTKAHNKSLILVTHDEELASSCDRILTIKEGRI